MVVYEVVVLCSGAGARTKANCWMEALKSVPHICDVLDSLIGLGLSFCVSFLCTTLKEDMALLFIYG